MFRSKRPILLFPFCFFIVIYIGFHAQTVNEIKSFIDSEVTDDLSNQTNFTDGFLDKAVNISKSHNFIYFTLINQAYFNLTNNWLCNTVLMTGVHERVLIVTTDVESERMLKKLWPNVAVYHFVVSTNKFQKKLDWGQKSYVNFLTLRSKFLTSMVEMNLTFVLFETDSIWLKNPTDYFSKFMIKGDDADDERWSFDVVVPVKYKSDEYGRDLTFNPMLVIPNRKTKKFFRQMSTTLDENAKLYDQDVLDDMCKMMYSLVKCVRFPYEDISDGYWFDLSPKYRKKIHPYVINNNYYVGVDHKITRQALNGFWYLKPKDQTCDFVMMKRKFSNDKFKW